MNNLVHIPNLNYFCIRTWRCFGKTELFQSLEICVLLYPVHLKTSYIYYYPSCVPEIVENSPVQLDQSVHNTLTIWIDHPNCCTRRIQDGLASLRTTAYEPGDTTISDKNLENSSFLCNIHLFYCVHILLPEYFYYLVARVNCQLKYLKISCLL